MPLTIAVRCAVATVRKSENCGVKAARRLRLRRIRLERDSRIREVALSQVYEVGGRTIANRLLRAAPARLPNALLCLRALDGRRARPRVIRERLHVRVARLALYHLVDDRLYVLV